MYERLNGLLSSNQIKKLYNSNILLVGVGGVGSVCFEVLIRSGIKKMTIVDFDVYEESNLNRQLHSNKENIGQKKVDVLKEYANKINPDIEIDVRDEFITKDSVFDYMQYDYIIDACDSVPAKVLLITKAKEHGKKIICSLGVGNRKSPNMLAITTLNKTCGDPLAKKLRTELKKANYFDDVKVVSSTELPIKANPISSYIGVSATAGILLADAVIKDLVNEEL